MKKKIFMVLVVLFVFTLGAIIVLQQGQPGMAVDQVLPQGAVAYFKVDHLSQKLDDLGQSRLWKSLIAIDWTGIVKTIGADEKILAQVEQVKQEMSSAQSVQVIKTFFGAEAAVAVYPLDLSELDFKDKTKSLSNFFFVTRLGAQTPFADFFMKYFSKANNELEVSEATYKDQDITIVQVPDQQLTFSYTRIKDLFVFGFGERAVQECLDAAGGVVEPLARDPYYLLAQTRSLDKPDVQGFVNFEQFVSKFKEQLFKLVPQQGQAESTQQFDQAFKQLQGIRVLSLSVQSQDALRTKLDVHFDETALAPEVKPFYQCAAKTNSTLGFVPQDVVLYQWNACQDWELLWKTYEAETRKAVEASDRKVDPLAIIGQVEQNVGLSLQRDIFPAFGHELGVLFNDVDVEGMFPVPQMTVLLDLQDQDKAQKIMDTLLGSQPLFSVQNETYAGEQIRYVNIPFVKNLQPAYSFARGYFFLSSHRDLIKQIFDTAQGPSAALVADAGFQGVDPGLSQPGSTAFFIRTDKLIDKVRDVLVWSQEATDKNMAKQDAFQKGRQQRLMDMTNNIEDLREKIFESEGMIAEIEETYNVKLGSPVARVEEALQRNERFKKKMQQGIDDFKNDLEALLAIKDSETQALPPEGEVRLQELKDNILKKQAKIKEIEQEIKGQQNEKLQVEQQLARKQELTDAVAQYKQEISSTEEAQVELRESIMGYDAQKAVSFQRKKIMDEMVFPLLDAVSNFQSLISRSVFGDDVVENEAVLILK